MFKDITIDLTKTNCYSDIASRMAQSLVSPQRYINGVPKLVGLGKRKLYHGLVDFARSGDFDSEGV